MNRLGLPPRWRPLAALEYLSVMRSTLRVIRYARSWSAGGVPVDEREIAIDRGGEKVPATLLVPHPGGRRSRGRGREVQLPGWVALHGITRPGRAHPSILRFARALAATPAVVMIPEIPEWRELELAPEAAVPTIKAAILALDERPETLPGKTGLVGFSFGCPQALIAAADPLLRGHLAGVVGFGGYADLERTFRFQFTGEHEWKGVRRHLRPDAYGRWVIGANYITRLPGCEDARDVALGLKKLAIKAGDLQVESWDPVHEPVKIAAREEVAPERRALFDFFAPPAELEPDLEAGASLLSALARDVPPQVPLLDPVPFLEKIEAPVRLLHGRGDHLIPYTETLRLAESFPEGADVKTCITGLFAHSGNAPAQSLPSRLGEGASFFRALREIFSLTG
jgi:pimeloyl-ACP methyl ester carboxylesterase